MASELCGVCDRAVSFTGRTQMKLRTGEPVCKECFKKFAKQLSLKTENNPSRDEILALKNAPPIASAAGTAPVKQGSGAPTKPADPLVDAARSQLAPNESVMFWVKGAYETTLLGKDTVRTGVFIATEERLVFYGKRFGGFDLESFPLENISSFELSKGLLGVSFKFFASNNRVHLKWIQAGQIQEFADYVRGAAGVKKTPQPADVSPPAKPVDSIPDQIRKLAELKDAGILTDEEFQQKKIDLLSRM